VHCAADGAARLIELPSTKTKTNEARFIPVGRQLAGVLAGRRLAVDGRPLPISAYVFGNKVGERVTSVRKAWEAAVLRAHGHRPQWERGHRLADASQDAYRAIDLHFHDLRREFGSRLLEAGAALHDVREFLGHANIGMTSRYLRSSSGRLAAALELLESRGLDAATPLLCTPCAHDGNPAPVPPAALLDAADRKQLNESGLEDGGPPGN